jgi:pilus assembly protein CpaB
MFSMARMNMNRNVIYLLVAVALGVLASFMAVQYINKEVAVRTPVDHTETVSVVVPVHPMQKGDILEREDISARDVPASFVPSDVVTPDTYESYLGQVLRAPLAQGAPLSASAVDLVADHFSNVINKGDVAYTIQVDDTNSVSGLMVPGDHVDILLMVTDPPGVRIMPLQSNVMVLATGHRAKGVQNTDPGSADNYSNVTLELTPGDAQRVAIAGKSGELRLMLRQAGSVEPFNLRSLSKEDLLRVGNQNRKSPGVEFIVGGRG